MYVSKYEIDILKLREKWNMGGCFLGCFRSSYKDTITPHYRKIKVLPQIQRNGSYEDRQSSFYPKQNTKAKPENQISIKEDKHDEQLSMIFRTNDAFDGNVKKDGPVSIEEFKHEERPGLRIGKRVTFDANVKVKTYELVSVIESTEALEENFQDNGKQNEESIEKPSLTCYPTNHRYNNCQESDEEVDELESEESYMCDKDSVHAEDHNENNDKTIDELSSLDMSQSARERGVYIHPMLNPVENLAQWNALKTKTKNLQERYKKKYRELDVDASLSNWLVSSESTSKEATYDGLEPASPEIGTEDTSTFGALATEELRELNVSISLTRSPSQDSDSVGTYWSYSGSRVKDIGAAFSYKQLPNITSKYHEVLVK